jgi:hypothetical protein
MHCTLELLQLAAVRLVTYLEMNNLPVKLRDSSDTVALIDCRNLIKDSRQKQKHLCRYAP